MKNDGEKGDNKDKPYDEISYFLKKHYNPPKEIDSDEFWDKLSKKIDSLFHKEILSEKTLNDEGGVLSEEERYYLGLEEYIKNDVTSLKHKAISDHILKCKECRQNYIDMLDKKKPIFDHLHFESNKTFHCTLVSSFLMYFLFKL